MQEEVNILKVIKHDDGTVQEVSSTADGLLKETYYQPHPHPASMKILAIPPVDYTPPKHNDDIKASSKQLFFYFTFWAIYLFFLILYIYPLNPFMAPKTANYILGPNAYPINCNRAPAKEYIKGCYRTFFCTKNIFLPTIKTPAGTFFPNFTKDDGQGSDYYTALTWATSYLTNDKCSNFSVLYSNNSTVALRNTSEFYVIRAALLEGLFILRHKCHPESVAITQSKCGAYRWNLVDIYDTSELNHSTCNFDWSHLYQVNFTKFPSGPPCNRARPPESVQYPEVFFFLEKLEILSRIENEDGLPD
ncbi:ORF27 [Bovine gammaherpesvirus 6]|uniref:ORF27 n=1 Tax=Bovine gammaherpesvirus 6 TaxID=1504288 RepID=A0A060CU07_9GAMA|nr:ORF27 [Bovine gammaherpesvirus 6]AIB03182.1 ORF27 [Bovine gammaherpesvirus 6]